MNEYVVYCPAHRRYLTHASTAGTTWTGDPNGAKHYPSKAQASKAAKVATWLDHNPAPWPVPQQSAEI